MDMYHPCVSYREGDDSCVSVCIATHRCVQDTSKGPKMTDSDKTIALFSHTYTYMCAHAHTHTLSLSLSLSLSYTHTHIPTHTHIYTHTHAHTHIHTHAHTGKGDPLRVGQDDRTLPRIFPRKHAAYAGWGYRGR